MILAEEVLRCLASGKKTTRELAVLTNRPPRHVASSCQCLAKRGLITSTVGLHKISAAGRRMLAEGYTIPCGPRKGEAVQSRNSLRQRAWRVMQMLPTWQVSDILNVIDDGASGRSRESSWRGADSPDAWGERHNRLAAYGREISRQYGEDGAAGYGYFWGPDMPGIGGMGGTGGM